jgi:predicted Na+-dependent transporter
MALIFAIGLGSKASDVAYLLQRPGLLWRSVLAMYVLVPLVSLALVALLPLGPIAKVALLLLAASAGAPLLPKKLGKIGNEAYVLSLVVLSSLLAIVVAPAWTGLLGRLSGTSLGISPMQMAALLGKGFLAPLAAGMVLRALFPGASQRGSEWLLRIAGVVVAVTALVLVIAQLKILLQVKWEGFAALAGLLASGLTIGHWLGGPDPDDRTALALFCATRHLGITVLVVTAISSRALGAVIVTYIVTSIAITMPYLKWRERASRSARAEPASAPAR